MRRVCALAVFALACDEEAPARDADPDAAVDALDAIRPEPEPVGPEDDLFLPGFRLDGVWHGGGRDGACTRDPASGDVTCLVSGRGYAVARESPLAGTVGRVVELWAVAEQAGSVEAVDAVGITPQVRDATSWISNGFQSWSQTGAIAIGGAVTDADLAQALEARGDGEVLRDGRALSWWFTAVGGGERSLVASVVEKTAEVNKAWFQVWRGEDERVRLRMALGGDGDPASEGAFRVFDRDRGDVAVEPSLLGLRGRAPYPPCGWNSWYELYSAVDEAAVRGNAARLAEIVAAHPVLGLEGHLPGYHPVIVIDDGWQRAWGDWWANDKFPSGLENLARDLAGEGLDLGLWMAPLLVWDGSELATAHPDWLLPDTVYPHLVEGDMRVLDITHPDAREHLLNQMRALSDAGVRLFKLDFLFAGTWPARRHKPTSGMAAYTLLWKSVREALPEDTTLVAVGAPPLPTLSFADSWRVGADIAIPNFGVAWAFLPNQLRSLAARQIFCSSGQCDPDPMLLRGQDRDQVEFGAWVVAAAGGGLFLSDDLRSLDPERIEWGLGDGRESLALSTGAHPESPFPPDPPESLVSGFADAVARRSRHVVPVTWRFPDGRRVAFNVRDEPVEVEGTTVPPRAARVLPAGESP